MKTDVNVIKSDIRLIGKGSAIIPEEQYICVKETSDCLYDMRTCTDRTPVDQLFYTYVQAICLKHKMHGLRAARDGWSRVLYVPHLNPGSVKEFENLIELREMKISSPLANCISGLFELTCTQEDGISISNLVKSKSGEICKVLFLQKNVAVSEVTMNFLRKVIEDGYFQKVFIHCTDGFRGFVFLP